MWHGVGQSWLQSGWQNSCFAMVNALISNLLVSPLGREICLIVCMLSVRGLCSNLRDSFGFRCGSSVEVFHSLSSSVLLRWKSFSMLLRCAPPLVFIRNNVRVVGDIRQS